MLKRLDHLPKWMLAATATLLLGLITWVDYATGYELELFAFYFIPVSIAAWFSGRGLGLAFSVASAGCWYLSDRLAGHVYGGPYLVYWGTLMRLVSFVTTSAALSAIRERTRQLEDLLQVVSHDLRTPLTVLSGQAQMLRRHGGQSAFSVARAEAMLQAARNMELMIDDLLDGVLWEAKKLRVNLEPIDLVIWVPTLLERLSAAVETQRIDLNLPASSVFALVDSRRLERVVLNLVSNALKYSPEESRICLAVSTAELAVVTISVTDRGVGIPEEERPHLFERFHRGKKASDRPGIGLGLYSARLLVLAQGGRLRVASNTGPGTTFLVDLPSANRGDESQGHHGLPGVKFD